MQPDHIDIDDYSPLHAELFSTDQMEHHGKALAKMHVVGSCDEPEPLLRRLDENKTILNETRKLLTIAIKAKRRITPAGEWLLDNFYLIEEQIRTAKQHLPKGYSQGLPRLLQGSSRGLPRVYDLALEAASHGDWRVDAETLSRFIAAYQTVTPLALGELWAIPIMLRLVLIEHLRRVSSQVAAARLCRNQAQDWANCIFEMAESDPKSLILVIADMARANPPMTTSFVAELARLLQGHGSALAVPLTWIETRLAESSLTIEQMVLSETRKQAVEQVSMSNAINSLRFLGVTDWREFVETLSVVEQVLRADYGDVYCKMDFATRDRYRHVIERLAKHSHLTEIEVARIAIGLAHRESKHVGYYLIDRGLWQMENAVEHDLRTTTLLRRWVGHHPLAFYLGTILLMTVVFATVLIKLIYDSHVEGWRLVLFWGLSILGASQLASSLTNWFATLFVKPQLLPRMDFSEGLPLEMCTLVVIPTMLCSEENIKMLLDAVEVRFLGNRDQHLHFALLTDFYDADQERLAEDEPLLAQVSNGIDKLNNKYRSTNKADTVSHNSGCDRFFLFHRARAWNPAERVWMGHERKRGKLADLNAALRGDGEDRFSLIIGNVKALPMVKYVITLDTDTQLPIDSARQLVSVMAHPLNHPHYDESQQRFTRGYSILQPRMATSLSGANRSRYAQLCGSEPGIDPYTRSCSDVYQDVFDEGSFIGKGIYDIDAFERILKDRLPENRILSHDLLEGCYVRSGLVSDVQLYEDHPARYDMDVSRQERWIRGDWQIAHWLMSRVPGLQGSLLANPLSTLSRWKIFDNLRRSLVSSTLLLLLLSGWCVVNWPVCWTLAILGISLIPPLLIAIWDVLHWPKDVFLHQHLNATLRLSGRSFVLAGFRITCLPYEAFFNLDAIVRTIWRMLITHRQLLEWRVLRIKDHNSESGVTASYRAMWISPFIAIVAMFTLGVFRPEALAAAGAILCLWLAAPGIVWWLNQPLRRCDPKLTVEQITFLRKTSRRTWAFFEHFVTGEDHWLPPDNFQEDPGPVIAHRTSPTNIGLTLLANLSACDFGFITVRLLIERTTNTFHTMTMLERHRGHFYNWYDTLSLQPLSPRYISSVDSGNLSGHLLTLHTGLLELPEQKIVGARLFDGLIDTLSLLEDALVTVQAVEDSPSLQATSVQASLMQLQLEDAKVSPHATCQDILHALEAIASHATKLMAGFDVPPESEAAEWARLLAHQSKDACQEILFLMPWLALLPAPEGLETFTNCVNASTLSGLIEQALVALRVIDTKSHDVMTGEQRDWLINFRLMIASGSERAAQRVADIEHLAQQATEFGKMEYAFLYDKASHLLAVGYNVDDARRDNSFYDLLASEARLSSFVAIAQGQVPLENWYALGRLLTTTGGDPILVSWTGSMFEYLMPLLVMPAYEGSLIEQSCKAVVARQIEYGNELSLPWGVSESGYNGIDVNQNYRYYAFGVPGLGLKRGLAEDLVVAPYASALALIIAPEVACINLQRLALNGLAGRYGFYEAIDYTPSRLLPGQPAVVVRSFMTHHLGMSLLAYAHLLLGRPMQRRFESAPLFQSALLLLQERIPKTSVFQMHVAEHSEGNTFFNIPEVSAQMPIGADTHRPEVQLLSNGHYHVMLTNTGGGYSRWNDLAITRWREDSTRDNWGAFHYLRDVDSNEFWSTTHQPTRKQADRYEVLFFEGRAEYRRHDHDIESHCEIVVSPEDNIELRRTHLTNRSHTRRTIEITSYAEVVLTTPMADMTQPLFGGLFVQTEIISESHAILCTRRPRSNTEQVPWMLHLLAAHGTSVEKISYETDRMRFIGRGRNLAMPQALIDNTALSGSQGSVLDPVIAIRCQMVLEPGQSAFIDWISGVAESRDGCIALVEKYQDLNFANRVFDLASTHSQVMLRQINAVDSEVLIYRRLAGSILYNNPTLRADASVLLQNKRGQSGLWGFSISGDLPIVLLKIADISHIDLARQMIQCHAYWRLKGLIVDLVIWNEDHAGYRQRLQDQIIGLIAHGTEANEMNRQGGIFVRSAEQISPEDRILLQSVARIVIADSRGTLVEQVNRRSFVDKRVAPLVPTRKRHSRFAASPEGPVLSGDGYFSPDGKEYLITTSPTHMTPLPWVNVLANANFGTVISESGLAYTWSENAHEFRLTPWSNDQVGASSGEAIYLRDEESGYFWSPAPFPVHSTAPYLTRHGFGYSVFEHTENGIHSELWVYVDLAEAVKYSVLKLRNVSGQARRLTATGYVEWVLGELQTKSALHIVTEIDFTSGALFAHNAYNTNFVGRVAFFDVDDHARTVSGDRYEFLGRNRSFENPRAMLQSTLSGKVGAGLDPCGAIQVPFELAIGQEREIIFRLGAGRDINHARGLALQLRTPGTARAALRKVQQYWQRTLGVIKVETPDPHLNVLANGWLLYQTLACRLWARSGFYQSGGAFGFRDQLQDSMALVHAEPGLVREHLLRCAEHQYPQGDVQHWWHPPFNSGVRTHCSDDYLWLPLATSRYVVSTGDTGVLDEMAPFLVGRLLDVEEESYYDRPGRSEEKSSLYQHCVRAIQHGLRLGEHGLPLMGSGDWNDGMNLVGIQGKGESVWLGFFLYEVLMSFAKVAHLHDDPVFAEQCIKEAIQLRENIEKHGWDGEWYLRAWFDDGSPLGSSSNSECQIDSIAQSWAVLSGAGDVKRSQMAMAAVDQHLVHRSEDPGRSLIQLLDPPFDKSAMNPGYIKGYSPGVRENGGQYTHAAIWAAMAFAKLGDRRRAWELLDIMNPLNHAQTIEDMAIYKTEPYVMAADVYALPPHTGRGGWSWYTGSAGWMYRLITESLLGLRREGNRLHIEPCMPEDWPTFSLDYCYGMTTYHIVVVQNSIVQEDSSVVNHITLDGVDQDERGIHLVDDQQTHLVYCALTNRPLSCMR
jgi:cellobiose phosphorylase